MEELNKAKNDVEKNNTRLASELKTLREKSEKVSHFLYSRKQLTIFSFRSEQNVLQRKS